MEGGKVGGRMTWLSDFVHYLMELLDKDASPSFGRAGAAFVVYFIVVWGCYLVSKTGKIPELPYEWVLLVSILWGGSIGKEAYVKGKEIVSGNSCDNKQGSGT